MTYSRSAAPGDLERLETFCNSARFLRAEDAFTGMTSARSWLREHRMDPGPLDRAGLDRLTGAREAIRDHLGGATPAALNRYAADVLSGPQWTEQGAPVLSPREDGGVDGLLGELLAILFTGDTTGETRRLRPCRSADCRWVFYDRSPAGKGVWCSMETCGSRHKMRAYRSRRPH